MNLLRDHWFKICIFIVVIIAIFLRFYNFENRWGLAYDQSRDVLVAREAIKTLRVPLIGPFASAGEFVYGPEWFWTIMVMTLVYSSSIIIPWIIQSLLYVLVVLLMIFIGKEIGGKFFGIIAGILTAVSPAQIAQSTNLTSPSMVAIFSTLCLFFLIKYIKNGRNINIFLFGICLSTAINIHFQAIGLLSLIPIILFFGKKSYKKFALLVTALIIPFIPLIIFNFKSNFFESRNILDYYLYGQYRIYVPNRWLTYVVSYWPKALARIIGGEIIFSYISIALLLIISTISIINKKINKLILPVLIAFFMMFVMLKSYRGERFDSYLVFIHPFILIIVAWVCLRLINFNRIIGVFFVLLLVFGSTKVSFSEIKNATNYTAADATVWRKTLQESFPNKKFSIYDFQFKSANKSLPLSLFLDEKNIIDDNGIKIGVIIATSGAELNRTIIFGQKGSYQLVNLNSMSKKQLNQEGWKLVNPSMIYYTTEDWYKR